MELFVYGDDLSNRAAGPRKYPARQTLPASQAIARSHGLNPDKVVFARQNPDAIDHGVFHNDVIAVGNLDLLFHHELAFADTQSVYGQLSTALGSDLQVIAVPVDAISLEDAVRSYLFNSQLLAVPGQQERPCCSGECREVPSVQEYLMALESESPLIGKVRFFDLRQSMNNGGGPACLRLRVVMSKQQIAELMPMSC